MIATAGITCRGGYVAQNACLIAIRQVETYVQVVVDAVVASVGGCCIAGILIVRIICGFGIALYLAMIAASEYVDIA